MEKTSNILPNYVMERPTPSGADGVASDVERIHRIFGCELIIQSGTVLCLPQVVIITGQNILNRFFYRFFFNICLMNIGLKITVNYMHRKSLHRFDAFSIAMGSLLLASKVEECFKTLREVRKNGNKDFSHQLNFEYFLL